MSNVILAWIPHTNVERAEDPLINLSQNHTKVATRDDQETTPAVKVMLIIHEIQALKKSLPCPLRLCYAHWTWLSLTMLIHANSDRGYTRWLFSNYDFSFGPPWTNTIQTGPCIQNDLNLRTYRWTIIMLLPVSLLLTVLRQCLLERDDMILWNKAAGDNDIWFGPWVLFRSISSYCSHINVRQVKMTSDNPVRSSINNLNCATEVEAPNNTWSVICKCYLWVMMHHNMNFIHSNVRITELPHSGS